MTRRGMRGFAAGLFIAAALIAYVHYTGDSLEDTIAKQPEITEAQVQSYLETNGKVAVDEDTYNELQASASKQQKESDKKEDTENSDKKDSTKEEQEKQIYSTTINIRTGMSSQEIITKLKNANVISSEDKLFDYLDKKNLLQKIQIGTFKLDSTMSIEEIGNKIT